MLWIGNGLYLRIGDVMLIAILIKKKPSRPFSSPILV